MALMGIGVDLIEVERIEHSLERFGAKFIQRVFTEGEIAYCHSMKFPARHFAARFAAKEAVSKAFGTGIGRAMGWRDIDVQKRDSGEPFVILGGSAVAGEGETSSCSADQPESHASSRVSSHRARKVVSGAPYVIPATHLFDGPVNG